MRLSRSAKFHPQSSTNKDVEIQKCVLKSNHVPLKILQDIFEIQNSTFLLEL